MSEKEKYFKDKFSKQLKLADSPPFLFIGSGISIRYCNIPTWLNLLEEFVKKYHNCFKHEFGYYSSRASNDPLKIASNLSSEFHEYWWKAEEFKENRSINSKKASSNVEAAFKIELSEFVKSKQGKKEEFDLEVELFSQAVLSGILTTNWDTFLQNLFPDYMVAIGQKEAIFANQKSIGNLYKIHGCISNPLSLVVTTNDYDQFVESNHYLNAKILTLFTEYPIIFIGYSLSDPNIEAILSNLISCLDKDLFQYEKLQNRLFFVEWQRDPCVPSIENSSYVSKSITIPLTKIKAHSYIDIWEVLSEIPRTLSVKTLRHLQDMVFDFVSSTKPKKKIFVNGIEELDKIEDLEVVVGFGNISKLDNRGLIGLKGKDLMEDILFDNLQKDNYDEIVKKVLPNMVKQNIYIPFFKYQKAVKNLNFDNSIKSHKGKFLTLNNAQKITICDYRVESNLERTLKTVEKFNSVQELIENESIIHTIQWIPYLEKTKIEINTLRDFLKAHWKEYGAKESNYSSLFRKCICLLDYLENANHFE
jgi:SIR2-like domain